MAVTAAESSTPEQPRRGRPRKQTTLDSHVDRPSVVEVGDPPFADTMDPNERATSVEPDKGAAATAGFGTVNAVLPLPPREEAPGGEKQKDRVEKYPSQRPDGSWVTVTHNLDTGETDTD